jgi:hypothetical protein
LRRIERSMKSSQMDWPASWSRWRRFSGICRKETGKQASHGNISRYLAERIVEGSGGEEAARPSPAAGGRARRADHHVVGCAGPGALRLGAFPGCVGTLGRARHATHQLPYSEGVIKSNAYTGGAKHAAGAHGVWSASKGAPGRWRHGVEVQCRKWKRSTPVLRAIRSNLPVVQRAGDMSQATLP